MRRQALAPSSRDEPLRSVERRTTRQLEVSGLTRRFSGVAAVESLDLVVNRGEIVGLLGPSGCGKTTTLRMIAGLEPPDTGRITVNGRVIVDVAAGKIVPTHKRAMGMVFQSYAIWPHKTVFENVAYPLRRRHIRSAELTKRVEDTLELVGLSTEIHRPATMLSGGQQQRVALARALVYEPELLLLDEPLSNLDAKLRDQMRHEIRRVQKELGVTMVFVTHDQNEAMSLADQLAVMNCGRIEQFGNPEELYSDPATPFVRDFLGRNIKLDGVVDPSARTVVVGTNADRRGTAGSVALDTARVRIPDGIQAGAAVLISTRPDDVVMRTGPASGLNEVEAVTVSSVFVGDRMEYKLAVGGRVVDISVPKSLRVESGAVVTLVVDPVCTTVWSAEASEPEA